MSSCTSASCSPFVGFRQNPSDDFGSRQNAVGPTTEPNVRQQRAGRKRTGRLTFPALPKRLIGRHDRADFPELGLRDIRVKVDTGAYTSAIHCHHIREYVDKEGCPTLSFVLLDPSHPEYDAHTYTSQKFRQKTVRSSNGGREVRYLIKTKIRLFERDYPVELSLSERGEMRYPVLLGRRLLRGRFIVDTQLSDVSARARGD